MQTVNKNLGEVLKKGESFYFDGLKQELEKDHEGEYAIIDVDSGEYIIHSNKIQAIHMAQEEFGHKPLYMVQIGDLDEPTSNFRERKNVAWIFQK